MRCKRGGSSAASDLYQRQGNIVVSYWYLSSIYWVFAVLAGYLCSIYCTGYYISTDLTMLLSI